MIKDNKIMQEFEEILFNIMNSAEQRIQAVFQLLSVGTTQALVLLIRGLKSDPSPIVRHECAYSIGEFKSQTSVDALIESIDNDENRFVRHEAALAVANISNKKSQKSLLNLLSSNDQDLVSTAEISLERLQMTLDNQSISDFYETAKETMLNLNIPKEHRIQAAFELLGGNTHEDVEVLIKALNTESCPIVKHEIIFSLGETASSRAVKALIETLKTDKNAFVVHESLLALGTIGNVESANILKQFLTHHDPNISESAEIALERLIS